MKKYSLTKEKKVEFGVTLFRIKANISFGIVSKGELGGWIEKEDNLDQEGNAWVSGDAQVYGDARVYGNAQVFGDARVYGNAQVFGNARVYGNAQVFGNAQVSGNAHCEFGWYFAYKEKDWDITEIPNGDGILLVKDYKKPTEEIESLSGKEVSVTVDGKTYTAIIK